MKIRSAFTLIELIFIIIILGILATVVIPKLAENRLAETNLSVTTEYATFESFYKESSSINWLIAGGVAIIAGVAIFFSAGTATPFVASIGTSIGGMMGLTGAAARNAGLALLGGGAITSGGLGIAGGAAVITAALTFSTEVITDFTINEATDRYSYKEFVQQSKNMITLPIPQNTSGSNAYEEVVEYLKKEIHKNESISSNYNQRLIQNALNKLKIISEDGWFSNDSKDSKKMLKKRTLYSLLYFLENDYQNAKESAFQAISLARAKKLRRTLPAFIFATSSLYDEKLELKDIHTNYFKYSVLAEPENQLIPLMFAIYLDRMTYRIQSDETIKPKAINDIAKIALLIKNKEMKESTALVVMVRYFTLIKIEQQKILALTQSINPEIQRDPNTLKTIEESLFDYKEIFSGLREFIKYSNNTPEMEKMRILSKQYEDNVEILEKKVQDFKASQLIKINPIPKKEVVSVNEEKSFFLWIFIGLVVLGLLIVLFLRLKQKKDNG